MGNKPVRTFFISNNFPGYFYNHSNTDQQNLYKPFYQRASRTAVHRENVRKDWRRKMKGKHSDSVQNRFTAYLMAAIRNTRKTYWERKYQLQSAEAAREDILERNYTDFDEQYRAYIRENTDFIFQDWQRYGELLALMESDRLAKAISRLKDRDRELLFARVYGGLAFAELGERFGMEAKQAEMAYYYVLRKLRKEMNGNDGF